MTLGDCGYRWLTDRPVERRHTCCEELAHQPPHRCICGEQTSGGSVPPASSEPKEEQNE